MLWNYSNYLCSGIFLLTLVMLVCAGYAYRVNARRAADDPKKRDFHPAAILLAPIIWPLLFFGMIFLFVLRALVYGTFLVLFTLALVVVRRPFVLIWLHRAATWIGDILLGANTFLIKAARGNWARTP